jgi:predicted ATP-binding protein involved in virulence
MKKLANPPLKYKPTPEQADIIETAKRLGNGEILIIRAAAGAAKTTTLKMISNAIGPFSRIGYIVFNKRMPKKQSAHSIKM